MAMNTRDPVWDSLGEGLSKSGMDRRIKAAVSQRGWEEAVRIFAERNIPPETLKVAEVGCGTGTMALTFALMGSAVTLIDNNEKVLERARLMYGEFGCRALFVRADCLEEPPASLRGAFDLVISSGLAEHFLDEDRKRCIGYHGRLARTGGIVSISVPNARSPMYRLIRSFRAMTGTWQIAVEAPFSAAELLGLAAGEGLSGAYVVGYVGMLRDIADGIRGLGYAAADALPKGPAAFLRRGRAPSTSVAPEKEDMAAYCLRAAEAVKARKDARGGPGRDGAYCSNIVLFAFK